MRRPKLLRDELLASASMSLSQGSLGGAADVTAALRLGAEAASSGVAVPLFVLLDLSLVDLKSQGSQHQSWRLSNATTASYDQWIESVAQLGAQRLPGARIRATETNFRWGLSDRTWSPAWIPFLRSQLEGRPPEDSQRWADAYRQLEADPTSCSLLLESWKKKRDVSKASWQRWWPATARDRVDDVGSAFSSRFAEAVSDGSSEERFDHAAARLFLSWEEPEFPNARARRLRLRRVVVSQNARPRRDSYEEQHPREGITTLATLVLGELGEFKIVNNSDPKIAAPPLSRPPLSFEVHLHWFTSYASLSRSHDLFLPHTSEVPGRGVEVEAPPYLQGTSASLVRALVATTLDDWRSNLDRGARVKFYAHRTWPQPQSEYVGRPGKRSKAVVAEDGPLPAAAITGLLFDRLGFVEHSREDFAWAESGARSARSAWHCAVVLLEDFPLLGLEEQRDLLRTGDASVWSGEARRIPSPVNHFVVVDAEQRSGWIARVVRKKDDVELIPITSATDPSADFLPLRENALDLLFDALTELASP